MARGANPVLPLTRPRAGFFLRQRMPAGSAVAEVEAKLKKRYGKNKRAVFGTLNNIGLMHGNKPTAKGLKQAKTALT